MTIGDLKGVAMIVRREKKTNIKKERKKERCILKFDFFKNYDGIKKTIASKKISEGLVPTLGLSSFRN